MTSASEPNPINKALNQNQESSLATSESSAAGAWLTKLPGFDQADLNAIVGRQRLSQALDLEQKPDNRYLRLSLYLLGVQRFCLCPWRH